MRQTLLLRVRVGPKHFPGAVLVEPQSVIGSSPYAISIYQHTEDMVVRKSIRGREVLPAEHRHVLSGCQRCRQQSQRNPHSCLHNVFKYSMRSFNSSLVRSLVTPWVSFGLNTVQISSSDRAEPSCK